MTTEYRIMKDIQGVATSGGETVVNFSKTNQRIKLTATTVNSLVVPTPTETQELLIARFKVISSTTDSSIGVWILPAASPVLDFPTGTADLTLACLIPGDYVVVAGQTIQLLSHVDADVSIQYYSCPFLSKG